MGYISLLRVTYLTLYDKYERPGPLFSVFHPPDPAALASRATFGLVLIHVLIVSFAFVHLNGGLPLVSKLTIAGVAGAVGIFVALVLQRYVERGEELTETRRRLSAQGEGSKRARYLGVAVLRWSSFVVFLVLLYMPI
jgi:hypothetical protein